MAAEPKGQPALAPGQRVLARLSPAGRNRLDGRTVRHLDDTPPRVLGVFRAPDRLVPTDRRARAEWLIPPGEANGAEDGEIILAEPVNRTGRGHRYGLKPARVVERLGQAGDARSVSLICIHTHHIPDVFDPAAVAEAEAARPVTTDGREDLRATPLVTIDGEDARDFDDAVWAEPDGTGWRLVVAIADVAHYVRAGSALDRDARVRGNSVYFPDRVVPMLPEALSNGLCSLRPDEDRGCLFAEMRVDAAGRKLSHRFGRGVMRSVARLTYTQVQDLSDSGRDAGAPGLLPALFGAFRALLAARTARGTLELDLPERKVVLDEAGRVTSVSPRPRLDSHRLIEEFMVLANVAAAEELERLHRPCVYRVHLPPSDEKLDHLRTVLHTLGLSLPPENAIHPRDLDRVLAAVAGTPHAPLVNETMLRAQSQAEYNPDNGGHFGLALPRYAHFTSPIRRYADLLVHRSLIAGLRLGPDGLTPEEATHLPGTAEHISGTERRAAVAEREAIDRYMSAFMADKVGAIFAARVSGVGRYGMFVTLAETGASGLVPMSALPDDWWSHDESGQALVGQRSGRRYTLAQEVQVRLTEATPITGGLLFRVDGAEAGREPVRDRANEPRREQGRPPGRRNRRT